MNKYISSLAISTIVVIIDQISKYIIQEVMSSGQSIYVIEDFFNLTYIRNKGGAFGIFYGMDEVFFLVVSFIAIVVVIVYIYKLHERERLLIVALSFILGGAIGNLIDRILYGEVIDFIDLYIGEYHWPAFNVADLSITIGVLMVILDIFKGSHKGRE